jgi:chromosomal replication initiator protein
MIRVSDVQRVVADYYGVERAIMKEPDGLGSRLLKKVYPRHVAICLASRLTEHSLVRIGDFFGGRDHSSVIHACRKIEGRAQNDPQLQTAMRAITLELVRA